MKDRFLFWFQTRLQLYLNVVKISNFKQTQFNLRKKEMKHKCHKRYLFYSNLELEIYGQKAMLYSFLIYIYIEM